MSPRPPTARRAMSAVAVLAVGSGALVAAATASAATTATATAASATAGRHAFPGSVPRFVATAPDAGPAAAATTVEGEVYLSLQDEVGAQAFATAVSTPGSSRYGHYLSPAAWISRYSPSRADLAAVEKYLTDSGLTIFAVPTSRQYVVFRGPAPKAAAAFGTTLRSYRVGGTTVTAPATAPTLPAGVASHVLGVSLGDSRSKLTRPANVRPNSGTAAAGRTRSPKPGAPKSGAPTAGAPKFGARAVAASSTACSSSWAQHSTTLPGAYGRTSFPTYLCGYLPSQLRSAGGLNKQINSGLDGTGQTVGIVDAYASPTIVRDTNDYMRAVGSPLLTRFTDISEPASRFNDEALCGGPSGWQGEQTLDVQSAHSVAPGARILYSGGFNCGAGIDVAVSKILDRGLANIVSNSYGYLGEAASDDLARGGQNIHLQAAGEGIGMYYSSGDSGDESINLGYTSPDFPASSPFVTAVGGTSEAIGANGSYLFETGWESARTQVVKGAYSPALPGPFRFGAGGGVSALFAEPAYQKGVVPAKLANSVDGTPSRVVPDIADLADPYTGFQIAIRPILDDTTLETGPLVYETYGGTSLASPIAAAKAALVQDATNRRIGFANPAIYAAAKALPSGFHDVVKPARPVAVAFAPVGTKLQFLVTFDQGLSLFAAKGYDTETGVGSLKVPALAAFLSRH